MKRLLAILLTLTLALGMLVACGDKEEAKDESSTASKEEQVSKDKADSESSEEISADNSEESSADNSEESSADNSEESSADSSEESVEDSSGEESADDRVKENPAEFVGTWYGNSYNTVGETLTLNADGTGVSDYTSYESEHFDWYVIDGEFYYYFYETEDEDAIEVATEQTTIDAENGTFSHVIINFTEDLYSYSKTMPELGGDDSLIGNWATEDGAYIFSFYEDGTGVIETEDDYYFFVWTADTENAYLVTYFDGGQEESYTYSASSEGASLITNGEVFNLAPYEYSYEEDEPLIDPDQPLGGDNSLVGTWKYDDDPSTITLKADGTGNFSMEGEGYSELKWFAENGSLTIVVVWEGFEVSLVAGMEYSIDGNQLTITEEMGEYTLTKV